LIRLATAADREFLVGLADRLADFAHPDWRTRGEIADGDRRALIDALDHPTPDRDLFVAEIDGARAGCLLMWTLEDYFAHLRHAHVSVLAVTRDAEGRGVGRALMERAERWARDRGYRRITLNVFDSNHRARALYERTGYQSETRRYVKELA
jgi:ribosomal protein S18 acetylase RimI-like enzyme